MEEHIHRLIIAYFDKTITDDGVTQLQEWIEENPCNLAQFSETIQILQAAKLYFKQPQPAQKSWELIQTHINRQQAEPKGNNSKILVKWMAAAAVGLVICACGLLLKTRLITAKPQYVILKNINGKNSRILLPDSSLVYLAGGSTLKYVANFNGPKRNVYLDGEAFFKVKHHTQKPFAVQSGHVTTVVLGTSFNVKAYNADNKIAITVQTGKVGVMANTGSKNRLITHLLPNEQIEIDTKTRLYTFNSADAEMVSSWINNDLVFYNTPLRDIATGLERHYGVNIEFTDPDLQSIRLTTRFKNISMPDAIKNISVLSGISYTQKGNQLFFTNKNQKGGKL